MFPLIPITAVSGIFKHSITEVTFQYSIYARKCKWFISSGIKIGFKPKPIVYLPATQFFIRYAGTKLHVTLLYANRDHNIPYKDEFEKFAQNNPSLGIHYIISPERIDENLIKKLVPDLSKPIFYVSGPESMVESLGNTLEKIGIAKDHIKQDYFPGYTNE